MTTYWTNRQWERDLSMQLSAQEWTNVHTLIHKGSMNVQVQESAYKLFSRWYRTPLLLHRFNPTIPQTCWRCNTDTGSLLHIWWSCSKIQPFWKEVHTLITRITTYTLDFNPAMFLLHHSSFHIPAYHRSLAMHLVNSARMCIPPKWRSPEPPTMKE